jgi:hypothetical protein
MKTKSLSSQPSKMCVPNLSLIVPLCTTVSAEKMFHNSTWASNLNNRYSEKNYYHPTRVTCSNHTVKPSSSLQPMRSGLSKAIRRQKLNRRKMQLVTLIGRSRSRDLPMTRAVTVNWERILQYPNECSIAQSQMHQHKRGPAYFQMGKKTIMHGSDLNLWANANRFETFSCSESLSGAVK